jgi:eukaryotic-like serine/threonine-protein kinase
MPAVSQQQVALPQRYRLVRHIANGGMASVWAAEDALLERLVAVKVLAPGYAADPTARRRFTREARAAARVSDHPHVVTVFDIGESTDEVPQAFIVMEHLAGGTVADRLRRGEPVPTPTALRWLREAASALDAAHHADIVHRDVKPGNLLLDERGRLAVGDFGIASIAGDTQVTAAGQVLGTAAYLSPEQARGHAATPASDRYSLAVVAYELLCGKRPFAGETPVAQARAHIEVEPPEPEGPCRSAAAVLKHGLAKDPAQRPPTAAAFVDQLEEALGDDAQPTQVVRHNGPEWHDTPRFARAAVPVPAPAADPARKDPTTPPPVPVARPRNPRRGLYAVAGVLAVCIGAGSAAALIGDDGNAPRSTPTTHRAASGPSTAAKPKKPAAKKPATKAKAPAAAAPQSSSPSQSTPPQTQTAPPQTTATQTVSDGRSPAQLNNAGYAMLPGNPDGALPLIKTAIDRMRAKGDRSLDYAFALYNYGWALRLAGRPAEAIPYLQERLQISNYKRGIVKKELKTAQRAAGQK